MSVRALIALILGAAAAVAIGCGNNNSNLLAGADAAGLKEELAAVRTALDDGECAQASQAAGQFERAARGLPSSVDVELRKRLREGAAQLRIDVLDDCRSKRTVTTDTTTIETTPTTTTTTTPTVPATTTTTTPTVPTIPTTIPTTPVTTTPGGTGGTGAGGAIP